MVTLDRIRLTGLLRKPPLRRGFLFCEQCGASARLLGLRHACGYDRYRHDGSPLTGLEPLHLKTYEGIGGPLLTKRAKCAKRVRISCGHELVCLFVRAQP